jgi:hypothetical protein
MIATRKPVQYQQGQAGNDNEPMMVVDNKEGGLKT